MQRSFVTDIYNILKVVPETEVELISALEKYLENRFNVAPEIRWHSVYYVDLARILNSFVGPLDEDWKIRVKKIFDGN
jgi:hypothetical protein